MTLREATPADWPAVADFFLETPLEAGTAFVLDRRPDFGALPGLRGEFRTFLVFQEDRLAGTVTALWHRARDDGRLITVGEVIDFRVAAWARGGRTPFQLLHAAQNAFAEEGVDWIVCFIGNQNRAAVPLVARRAGLPWLAPLQEFASVHFMAWRVPRALAPRQISVREARASDARVVTDFCEQALGEERFAPAEPMVWPDPTGRHRAWIAVQADGIPCGVLVVWDGTPMRQLRIVRYRAADLPLRLATRVAALLGLTVPLPRPGGALGLWGSRVVAIRRGGRDTLRALLGAAMTAAVDAGKSVVQLNMPKGDPLLRQLPAYPRSTFWSTLYGVSCNDEPIPAPTFPERYHADVARI